MKYMSRIEHLVYTSVYHLVHRQVTTYVDIQLEAQIEDLCIWTRGLDRICGVVNDKVRNQVKDQLEE
jgi:murein tripeptide amidase MpaA